MESKELVWMPELDRKFFQIFSDFMTRVTQFEESMAVGSRLLVGFHQGLVFLQRPPINKTSELVERIIRANETERVVKYVEAGCENVHDSVQHISKFKRIVGELDGLVKEVTAAMQAANESQLHLKDEFNGGLFGPDATPYDKEANVSSDLQKPEITEYAVMMGIIYSMVKKDYMMQEKIISSLDLKSSSGELEGYSLMWSLRPFIDDEIMHQAWRLIP